MKNMKKLTDTIKYIVSKYNNPEDLTISRMYMILYIVDSIYEDEYESNITGVGWEDGPYHKQLVGISSPDDYLDDELSIENDGKWEGLMYGSNIPKRVFRLSSDIDADSLELDASEKNIIDDVIDKTQHLTYSEIMYCIRTI